MSIITILFTAFLGASINHLYTSYRAKKERKITSLHNQLQAVLAPLLAQVTLLKVEINSWEDIQKDRDTHTGDSNKNIWGTLNAHHLENIISMRQNILNLLTGNYGMIDEKSSNKIMDFLRKTQSISIVKIQLDYMAFQNENYNTNPVSTIKIHLNELEYEITNNINEIKGSLKALKANNFCDKLKKYLELDDC